MTDETERPLTRAELEAWAEGFSREIRGGGRSEGGGGSPAPAARPAPAPPGAEDESPVLREAREIEATRARQAEEVRLTRTYLQEQGGLTEDVVGALTDEEVRILLEEGSLGIDANADSPSANVGPATRIPGSGGLMDREEIARRRAEQETTVDPEVVRYRREHGIG